MKIPADQYQDLGKKYFYPTFNKASMLKDQSYILYTSQREYL